MAAAPATGETKNAPLLKEIWAEKRPVFKALVADVLIFLVVLAALFLCYIALRGMEAAGYPSERIARLEQLHYWAYVGVIGLFLVDLVLKLFVLFIRKNHAV